MKIEINSCGQIFLRVDNYLITFSGLQDSIRPFGYFCVASFNLSTMEYEKLFLIEPFNLSRMEYEKLFLIEPDLTGDQKGVMKIEINSCGQIFIRVNNYLVNDYLITFSGLQDSISFGYFCIASFNLSTMEYEKLFLIEPDLTGDQKWNCQGAGITGKLLMGLRFSHISFCLL